MIIFYKNKSQTDILLITPLEPHLAQRRMLWPKEFLLIPLSIGVDYVLRRRELILPSIYVFSYFPCGFDGRMWDLIVSVPDHCLSFYFALYTPTPCVNRGKSR